MNTMIIVDTSVWIEFFRNAESELTLHLKDLLRRRIVVMVGVVLAEILQGIKQKKEENLVKKHFQKLPYEEISREIWAKSGHLSASLRRKGITIPLTDLIIAAIALSKGYEVFTIDPHFTKVGGLMLHSL